MLWWKFTKFFMSFSKLQISFSSNFTWLFSVMRHNSSVRFYLKLLYISTNGVYESTNLVKFNVSSQKSEILQFDGLLLFKSYKILAKKVQKSYLSWDWGKVMQSLKKNLLVVSSMTWGIWWIFTEPLKSRKMRPWWALFVKNTGELSFMTLNSDEKFE